MDEGMVISEILSLGGLVKLMGYEDDGYYRHVVDEAGAELDLLTMTALLVRPGYTVFDVGANIGFYSISAARLMDGKGKVVSFEPSPVNFKIMNENAKLNGLDKMIAAHKFGLSDSESTLQLHYNKGNRGGAFIADIDKNEVYMINETIKTKVLDKISRDLPEKCDVIKIDIEGHEPHFLRGAEKFIAKNKPAAIMEANHWCLNALTNVTLPDFLHQVYELFPYVYAFDGQELVNVREREMYFMHENIVHNRLQNLYCDFDLQRVNETAASYERFLQSDRRRADVAAEHYNWERTQIEAETERLREEVRQLQSARSHRAAARINKIIGR